MKKLKGFTLIELIVVIGIIAILAAIVIIAVNPARQFAQARNTTRNSDVLQILNAVYQYSAENNGDISGLGITNNCNAAEEVDAATFGSGNNVTLASLLAPTYLTDIPADPRQNPNNYTICVNASNRVTVSAPSAELGTTISVTR